jgi:hypothetical protein
MNGEFTRIEHPVEAVAPPGREGKEGRSGHSGPVSRPNNQDNVFTSGSTLDDSAPPVNLSSLINEDADGFEPIACSSGPPTEGINSNSHQVCFEEAAKFVHLIAGNIAVTFQTFADPEELKAQQSLKKIKHGTVGDLASELNILNMRGAGIFMMLNAGDLKGRSAKNVVQVRAVFADLDGAPLDPVREASLRPHIITETSPGRHQAFWIVLDMPLEKFKDFQRAIAAKFSSDAAVCDLPRVVRVPGFFHRKAEPFRSRIMEIHESQPYTMQELIDGLGLSDLIAKQTTALESVPKDRGTVNGLKYPESVIYGVQEHDPGRTSSVRDFVWALKNKGTPKPHMEVLALEAARNCSPPLEDQIALEMVKRVFEQPSEFKRPAIISISELVEHEVPEPDFIIDSLLSQGVTLLSGAPKSGKSWLTMELGLAVASGKEALGRFRTQQGSVLFLSHEDSQRLFLSRIRQLIDGRMPPPENAHYVERFTDKKDALDHITHFAVETENLALIIIDTLARIRGGDLKNKTFHAYDYESVAPLVDLADNLNIAILLVHHTRKAEAEDHVNRASGSSGLTGGVDNVFTLTSYSAQKIGKLEISGRYLEDKQLDLRFDKTCRWTWIDPAEAAKNKMSQERLNIISVLAEHGPLPPKDIAALLDRKSNPIRALLLKMKKDGEVLAMKDGCYQVVETEPSEERKLELKERLASI